MFRFVESERAAVVCGQSGAELSYSDLQCRIAEFGAAVGGRCLIACVTDNSLGGLLGFIACSQHRCVALLASSSGNGAAAIRLLRDYRPQFIWCSEDLRDRFGGCVPVWRFCGCCLLRTEYSEVSLHADLAVLLTTSGSTGSPKFVRLSYENLRSNAESIVQYLGITAEDRAITSLPMSYSYGLSVINSHLLAGASIVVTERSVTQREFWECFRRHEVTSLSGVPYTYQMLDRMRFFGMDLPSLRTLTQAGGRLSPELQQKFAEHCLKKGWDFYVMYGQTEATARMSYLPPEDVLRCSGSIGRAIPGGRLSLLGDDGTEVNVCGVPGELVYEGPNVMLGYAESVDDLARGDELHGRLRTGDLACRDADGYFRVVGRLKRFLKIFGNRVNLDEVEQLVRSEFPRLESAVAGRDDRLCVFIAGECDRGEVVRLVAERLGLHSSGFECRCVPEIPRGNSGKILYHELSVL